jgi:hypothetical protein
MPVLLLILSVIALLVVIVLDIRQKRHAHNHR